MAAVTVADKPNNNAIALKKINDAWKGSSLEAARTAAFDIGMLGGRLYVGAPQGKG
jgi:hypothetical protein